MKSHHLLKVELSIILGQIGSLYRKEMGWRCHFIDNNPNKIVYLRNLGNLVIKSILIISHFHSISPIDWAKHLGLWFSIFICWQLEHLATNSAISFYMPSHQYASLPSRYILVNPGWMEYLELWASSRVLSWSPFTLGTHNLPWYFCTPSLHCSKVNILCL